MTVGGMRIQRGRVGVLAAKILKAMSERDGTSLTSDWHRYRYYRANTATTTKRTVWASEWFARQAAFGPMRR
eukprot:803501-Rhodomonas_salina.2